MKNYALALTIVLTSLNSTAQMRCDRLFTNPLILQIQSEIYKVTHRIRGGSYIVNQNPSLTEAVRIKDLMQKYHFSADEAGVARMIVEIDYVRKSLNLQGFESSILVLESFSSAKNLIREQVQDLIYLQNNLEVARTESKSPHRPLEESGIRVNFMKPSLQDIISLFKFAKKHNIPMTEVQKHVDEAISSLEIIKSRELLRFSDVTQILSVAKKDSSQTFRDLEILHNAIEFTYRHFGATRGTHNIQVTNKLSLEQSIDLYEHTQKYNLPVAAFAQRAQSILTSRVQQATSGPNGPLHPMYSLINRNDPAKLAKADKTHFLNEVIEDIKIETAP